MPPECLFRAPWISQRHRSDSADEDATHERIPPEGLRNQRIPALSVASQIAAPTKGDRIPGLRQEVQPMRTQKAAPRRRNNLKIGRRARSRRRSVCRSRCPPSWANGGPRAAMICRFMSLSRAALDLLRGADRYQRRQSQRRTELGQRTGEPVGYVAFCPPVAFRRRKGAAGVHLDADPGATEERERACDLNINCAARFVGAATMVTREVLVGQPVNV
ncbi:hypothetical protein BD413DRAFT_68511 [Trametes elegans]|nr:hypothetical protein BD413DRAFT_68511 [Trametes elegans]